MWICNIYCIDDNLEIIKCSGSYDTVHYLCTVVTRGSHVPSPGKMMSCVVHMYYVHSTNGSLHMHMMCYACMMYMLGLCIHSVCAYYI